MDVITQYNCRSQTAWTDAQEASKKQQFISKKCFIHQDQSCDLLHLKTSAAKHQICAICAQQDRIPLSEVLFIDNIINADSNSFFSSFPVLTDRNLINQVETASRQLDQIIKQTDQYFSDLQQKLNSELEIARSRAKTALAKLSGLHFQMIGSFQEVSKIEELKKIIIDSNKSNNDHILHEYILNLFQQASINTQRISDTLNSFQNFTEAYNLPALQDAQKQLIEKVQSIEIFNSKCKGIIMPFNVLPSSRVLDSSQNLSIIKESTGSIIITSFTDYKQCYLDMELEMNEKYIIKVELIHNNMEYPKNLGFAIGLIQDSLKQSKIIQGSKICYCECIGGNGIDKIVKGPQLFSNKYSKTKRFLEFRIHLASRYIRAANLPDYSSVVELDDNSKINEGEKYYFGIYISLSKDQVRVVEVIKAKQFDDKMD